VKKTILISVIISIITSLTVFFALSIFMPNKLSIGENYYEVGGVIRNIGEGWFAIDDSGHEPIGITNVETTKDSVVIHYSKANKAVFFSVTPDETMTSEGYTMGASVGLDNAIINIYDKDHNIINPNDYKNSKGNIWVNGRFKK